uniref:Zgc:174356 n=1 Tax=Sinocyclocheilus grahami TaxID=75366 RepID=A0A672T1Q7_SINGR
ARLRSEKLNMRCDQQQLDAIIACQCALARLVYTRSRLVPLSEIPIRRSSDVTSRNDTICSNPEHHKGDEEVQATASYILLLFNATLSLVSIPPAIMLGSWSDRAGRRWVMALPSVLSLLSGGLLLAVDLLENISVYWTLMAAALTGLTGGHVTIFLSSFSYLADLTMGSSSSRTLRMALAESMIFVGGSVGFLLGGFLEQEFGLKSAFGAYIGCHVLYAKLSFKAVFKRRSGQERLKLHFLILCTFINNLVALFSSWHRFPALNCCAALWQGFGLLGLFPVLMRCMKDMTLAKLSALFRIASYPAKPGSIVFSLDVCFPSLLTCMLMSSGAMFSFSASVEATCILIAAMIFNGLYPLTLPTFSGMPFIIMAVFTLIVLILLQKRKKLQNRNKFLPQILY